MILDKSTHKTRLCRQWNSKVKFLQRKLCECVKREGADSFSVTVQAMGSRVCVLVLGSFSHQFLSLGISAMKWEYNSRPRWQQAQIQILGICKIPPLTSFFSYSHSRIRQINLPLVFSLFSLPPSCSFFCLFFTQHFYTF